MFWWAIGSTILVSLISLVGVFTLAISDKALKRIVFLLMGFSAGALLGGARFAAEGERGGCLELPEAGSRAEAPDAPALNLPDEFTVACWARRSCTSYPRRLKARAA